MKIIIRRSKEGTVAIRLILKKSRPDSAMMKEPTILLSRLHLIVLKLKQTQESSRDCVGNMHFWVLSQGIWSIFTQTKKSQFSGCLWGSTELKTIGRRTTTGHRRPRGPECNESEWVRAGRRKYTSLGLQLSPGLACFWLLCAQMTNWVTRMIVNAKELNLGNPGIPKNTRVENC